MRSILFFLIAVFTVSAANAKEITQIKGYAPAYVGKTVEVFQTLDYLTMRQERIATATVLEDSTFTCSFYLDETKRLTVQALNNKGTLICEPGKSYEIFVPDRNPYDPYRPAGNLIELTLFNLDSTDVNYKVLQFNQWTDQFIATYYTKNNADKQFFAERLDTFKIILQNYYKVDTLNAYFNYHRQFTLAKIDDLRFLGSRNQYEKYDFYIKNTPVYYQSDAYMEYIQHYYEKFMPRVNMNTNNKVYLALLKSSPTLIMRALGTEYTMQNNLKLRELMMINIMGECFYEKDYPQTNILTVLDSLQKKCLFPDNRLVAENMYKRLTELTPGGKAPDFAVSIKGETNELKTFNGKHLYLFFVTAGSEEVSKQMEILVPLFHKYQNEVEFLMIVKDDGTALNEVNQFINKYPWKGALVNQSHAILKDYQVTTFPYYVLVDRIGHIVGAPALGPLPNGQYETIDKTFFAIKKAIEEGTGDGR